MEKRGKIIAEIIEIHQTKTKKTIERQSQGISTKGLEIWLEALREHKKALDAARAKGEELLFIDGPDTVLFGYMYSRDPETGKERE